MTYNVNSDNTAVEVQGQTPEANLDGQSLWLWLVGEVFTLEEGWDGVCDKNTAGWEELWREVVSKDGLKLFLGWLWCVLRDLLESAVGGSEDSVIGLGAVQSLNQVRVVVQELSKLGGVLGLGDELVDGLVRFAVLRRVVWSLSWVMRRMSLMGIVGVVRAVRVVVTFIEEIKCSRVNLALSPRLGVKGLVGHAGADFVGETESLVEGTLSLALGRPGVLSDSLSNLVEMLLEAVEDVMLGLVSTMVGLDGNIVQDVLVRQDKGRGQSSQRQDGKVLHNGRWME